MRELWNKLRALWPSVFMFLFTAGLGFAAIFIWPWLSTAITTEAPSTQEEASTIFRNLSLIFLGGYGIYLAKRRLTAIDRTHTLDKRSALFDRFQRSSEMLDSENIAVRQAGLYTLAETAREQPNDFYVMVQSLYCGFMRDASTEQSKLCSTYHLRNHDYYSSKRPWPPIPADMQDAMNLFTKLRKVVPDWKKFEQREQFRPDLSGLFVPGHMFENANFSGCDLDNSVFCDAQLNNTSFKGGSLRNATFDRAAIEQCDLTEIVYGPLFLRWARFDNPKISGEPLGPVYINGTAAIGIASPIPPSFEKPSQIPMSADSRGFPHFDNFESQGSAQDVAALIEGTRSYHDEVERRIQEEIDAMEREAELNEFL